jgi:NagD protein
MHDSPRHTAQLPRLARLRHLALDLDGTLYLGGRIFPWTAPFLDRLRALRIGRTFFTNNSSRSTRQYLHHLRAMQIDVAEGEIYSSTSSTLDYLRSEMPEVKRLYVLGTPGLREEFAENGFAVCGEEHTDEPDAVVVGFDTTLVYARLCRAAYWISRGKPFIATHPDAVCPTDQPTVLPDCGAMCALLQHATGRAADVVLGKPNPRMLEGVMRRHDLPPEELAVVGDRLYTDMAMARGAGAMGILVLTGETTPEQADRAEPPPDLVVPDVGQLGAMIQEATNR